MAKKKQRRATPEERDLKLLTRVASYIYGERWQRDLAEDLELNERTVRGWLQQRTGITPGVWLKVGRLLKYKIDSADGVQAAIEKRINALAPAE